MFSVYRTSVQTSFRNIANKKNGHHETSGGRCDSLKLFSKKELLNKIINNIIIISLSQSGYRSIQMHATWFDPQINELHNMYSPVKNILLRFFQRNRRLFM